MVSETSAACLHLNGISKSYGASIVLNRIDLGIEEGEFLTILGPSGSGKTTILRLIGGFSAPSSGRILFREADITRVPIHRRPFNTVFQDYALFPHMTVGANVGYGLMVRGISKPEISRRVGESLEVVGLEGFAKRYPAQLSGGQQQRIALARALICSPQLILLDEPLAALDAGLRRQMQQFLKSIQRQTGITFVFVTHDQEEAITMSDRICVIRHGGIEQLGSPETIYYRPRSEFVATFFGDNNLLAGNKVAAAGSAKTWHIDTLIGSLLSDDDQLRELANGAGLTVAIRPEALRIAMPGQDTTEISDNRLEVEVKTADFIGPIRQLRVRSLRHPDQALLVKLPSRIHDKHITAGTRLTLLWNASDCAVIAASG